MTKSFIYIKGRERARLYNKQTKQTNLIFFIRRTAMAKTVDFRELFTVFRELQKISQPRQTPFNF